MAYISFQPNDYFNTKLYTGDNTSNRGITGIGFQPDWVWNKSRSNAYNHYIFDAVRGAGKRIGSNSNAAEDDKSAEFISFDSDGFTLTNNAGSLNINGSGVTFANWCWKANGQGSSNTDGSINTTYTSANTTSGFSIVKYTGNGSSGATIGHGLGVVPKVVIVKLTSGSGYDWGVYHASLGNTKNLRLNLTDAEATSTAFWNDTTPSSSLVTLGNNATVNGSGSTYIAYCFAEKQGFSKFGSYTGNGSTDGAFVYTGFKPAFVMVKRTDTTGDWGIFDNKREGYNDETNRLKPNASDAEEDDNFMDILSNGFKLRLTSSSINASGGTFIFMAFAEAPLVSSNGVPTLAR